MTSFPVRLAYVTFEPVCGVSADLPPVLFLHGTTATKECWGSIPQHIADKSRRKVYCLDSRNHGDSEWSDVFNFDVNINDLLHFMDSQQIPKAVLIGHSMGGVTCMRTSFKQPDRVEMAFVVDMFVKRVPQRVLDAVVGLVEVFEEAVSSIPPQCSEDEAQRRITRHAAGSKALTDAIFTIFRKSISQRKSNTVPKWITSRKEASANKKPKSNANLPLKRNEDGSYSLKFNSKVIKDNMLTEELVMSEPEGIFEGPVYFLYGTESPYVVNEDSERIYKHFPNAKIIGIEGSGHNVYLDMPDELEQEILNHLKPHS
ncbi:hypothetical protein JTE90_011840 [Oedothorax gibbosus]|uniref:sn-1-specific diacylglycerol lipase ABHD11 n=1 Tax=Oedothorax gibbosus TaxID=931172 RepID=A0AAV6U2B8_9ARAC|nr:hypothetical protein JTE90_011840 [Oedothorax gibbosus]